MVVPWESCSTCTNNKNTRFRSLGTRSQVPAPLTHLRAWLAGDERSGRDGEAQTRDLIQYKNHEINARSVR